MGLGDKVTLIMGLFMRYTGMKVRESMYEETVVKRSLEHIDN
jgi:hypothetical protein